MQLFAKTIFDLFFIRILLLLLFVSSFNMLTNLADTFYYHLVSFATLLFVFSYFIYYFFDIFKRRAVSKFTILQVTVLVLFIIPIFQALRIFGQPLYYGVIAQINLLLCFSSLLILELLRKKIIDIKKVERFFLLVALSTLTIFLYFNFFVDPVKYVDSHLVSLNDLRGYRFKFYSSLLVMLYFYSLFKVAKEKSIAYLILHLIVIAYFLFLYQSRTYIVTIALTTGIYMLRNISSKFLVKWALVGILALSLSFFFIQQLRPDVIDRYKALYTNALMIFFGENTDEYSTNARIKQYDIVVDYILEHPILGNGMISNSWNEGWRGIFGYFYPSDIGIFGTLFVFGLLGTSIFYILFLYGFVLSRQIKYDNLFLLTVQYTLLFLFFTMFFQAFNIKNASVIYFLLAIIYYYRYYHKNVYYPPKKLRLPADQIKQKFSEIKPT